LARKKKIGISATASASLFHRLRRAAANRIGNEGEGYKVLSRRWMADALALRASHGIAQARSKRTKILQSVWLRTRSRSQAFIHARGHVHEIDAARMLIRRRWKQTPERGSPWMPHRQTFASEMYRVNTKHQSTAGNVYSREYPLNATTATRITNL